jgi:hypothetical protein
MTELESRIRTALGIDEWTVFDLLESNAAGAVEQMNNAWHRPVRHNRKIERLALTRTVNTEKYCRHIVATNAKESFVTPPLPDPAKRYDIEAAIRTIPDLIPFTWRECELIRGTKKDEAGYYGGIDDDPSNERPELLSRWHEWLWTPKSPGERAAVPNPEAEVLAIGYACLAEGMLGATAIWRASVS